MQPLASPSQASLIPEWSILEERSGGRTESFGSTSEEVSGPDSPGQAMLEFWTLKSELEEKQAAAAARVNRIERLLQGLPVAESEEDRQLAQALQQRDHYIQKSKGRQADFQAAMWKVGACTRQARQAELENGALRADLQTAKAKAAEGAQQLQQVTREKGHYIEKSRRLGADVQAAVWKAGEYSRRWQKAERTLVQTRQSCAILQSKLGRKNADLRRFEAVATRTLAVVEQRAQRAEKAAEGMARRQTEIIDLLRSEHQARTQAEGDRDSARKIAEKVNTKAIAQDDQIRRQEEAINARDRSLAAKKRIIRTQVAQRNSARQVAERLNTKVLEQRQEIDKLSSFKRAATQVGAGLVTGVVVTTAVNWWLSDDGGDDQSRRKSSPTSWLVDAVCG